MAVTVYTLPDCISCDLTKRAFTRRGVEFEEVPLDEELSAEFRSKGYLSAPIVVTNRMTWYGLRPDYINDTWKDLREPLGGARSHNGA